MWKPESTGSRRLGPLDWTLDELIEYRKSGVSPKRILDKDVMYKLGKVGVSFNNVCFVLGVSQSKVLENRDYLEAWQTGRAECGARIRASIVQDALEKDLLPAKLYLDKILSGDTPQDVVNINVNTTELTKINTNDLLEIMYRDGKEDTDEQG